MTDLAKLVVRLEAQTAQYMQQLDAAQRKLDKFTKQSDVSMKNIAAGVAAAAVGAAVGFARMSKEAIDSADNLYKMSQSTGIATENLSQLQYVADLSGVSTEDLSKSLSKLARVSAEAAKGAAAPKKAFDMLGVSVQNADGSMRDSEELMLDIADRFANLEDGAGKTALAMEIFGKSGANLIPFLNQGRDGIEAMKREADALGLTLGSSAAKAAEEFNDNLSRMDYALKGLVSQVTQENIPMMTAISERFVEAAKTGGALDFAVKALSVTFKGLVSAGAVIGAVFENIGRVLYGVGAAIVRLMQGEFRLAKSEIADAMADVKNNVSDTGTFIAEVWGDKLEEVEVTAKKLDGKLKETIIFNDEKAEEAARKAADSALGALKSMSDGLIQTAATFNMSESAVIRYRLAYGDLADEVKLAGEQGESYANQIIVMTEYMEYLKKVEEDATKSQESWNRMVQEADGIVRATITPLEEYEQTMLRLDELHRNRLLDAETYKRASDKAKKVYEDATKEHNTFLEEANKQTQNILADGIGEALDGGVKKGVKGALKAFEAMIIQMTIQAAAANLGAMLFGGGGMGSGGGWVGSALGFLSGGSRDSGGRGSPGKAYMIGTGAQPELFVPDSAGEFYPANKWMRGGSGGNSFTINVTGRTDQRSARQIALETSRQQRVAQARFGG